VAALTEHQGGSLLDAGRRQDLGRQENTLWEKSLLSLGTLPPFSPILNQLMASLADEEASFSKLADLIEKDAVVTGNLLHLVNSALHARSGTINSVRHAVSVLGINKLRNAVLGMSISRMWSKAATPTSWSMARFNMHSAATAILSDMLAQPVPTPYPEGAFVAGLLHDVGRLLIAIGLGQEHEKILLLYAAGGGRSLVDCETELLGFAHPQLSAEVLARWKLPEAIRDAVAQHHCSVADSTGHGGVPLARIVAAADQYVTSLGVTILLPGSAAGTNATPDTSAIQALGVKSGRLETLLGEFDVELENMAPFFQ
jgi:HD-like signal output (HDOD) protein